MIPRTLTLILLATLTLSAQAKRKVFIDQDASGPGGTDMQSMLILLQSPVVEVLGISITSGDGWAKAGVQNTLRMLELTGHGNVPLAQGAEFPLINTREETALWETQYGALDYKGAWNEQNYHEAGVVPPLEAGNPAKKALSQHGALFLIETLRKYPGEVTVWMGGPLTTVALAIRLDPEVPRLAKELVLMGSGLYADQGGIPNVNGRREFNWWWDPEATRIVMSASWRKITITPVDISVKTRLSGEIKAEIAKSSSATARYLTKYSPRSSFMWDEIAAAALVDPSIITQQKELYVNVDIGHGAGYGQTIFMETTTKAHSWLWRPATVQFDLDTARFYRMYIDLMKK